MKSLPFDTETTDMPIWGKPSGLPEQPHLVQLAALLMDDDTQEVVESMDVIIKPEGWVSCPEALETHGITTERAMDEGIPEETALDMYMSLWEQCAIRVAHNTTFDNRMIRIALKRYQPDRVSDEVWKDRDLYFCTLQKSKKIMGGKSGHTLAEAYKHFIGEDLEGAHDAMVDTQACAKIYYAIKALE